MQFGAHTFGFVWQLDAERALAALGAAGFKRIQLMAAPPHFDPWKADSARTAKLRAILESHGMSVIALDLASNDINLASPAEDVREFAVQSYVRTIERGAELNARAICVGSGRGHPLLSDINTRLMDGYRRAFAQIQDKAAQHGQLVLLENHPLGLLAKADAIDRFLASDGSDNTAIIYDVANAHAVGENPADGLATLSDHIEVLHLSDAPPAQWRHDPIGSGVIDFAAIMATARRIGFDGDTVLEILSSTPLDDLLAGAEAIRALSQ